MGWILRHGIPLRAVCRTSRLRWYSLNLPTLWVRVFLSDPHIPSDQNFLSNLQHQHRPVTNFIQSEQTAEAQASN